MNTLRLKKIFRRSLFAAALILLQLNVGCTGQQANSLVQTGGVSLPDLTGTAFGDNYQLDDPFGTGSDFSSDDFVFTDVNSTNNLDEPVFNLDGSGASLQNDCINADLFATGNVNSSSNYLDGCLALDNSQFTSLPYQGNGLGGGIDPLQLLASQVTQGTLYGLECINVAYLYVPIVNQDPEVGITLAIAAISDCYRQIFNQVAASPYWASSQGFRMQSFEPEWISFMQQAMPR